MTLIQKKILFAAISTPLYLVVIERRKFCWSCGPGHSTSSKVALCVISSGSFNRVRRQCWSQRSKVGALLRRKAPLNPHPHLDDAAPKRQPRAVGLFREMKHPQAGSSQSSGPGLCLFPSCSRESGYEIRLQPNCLPSCCWQHKAHTGAGVSTAQRIFIL